MGERVTVLESGRLPSVAERDAPVQRGTDAQRAHLASRFALCVGSAVVILLCDQLAKALVVHSLGNGRVIDLFGGLLRLDFTRNSGAAFGMFQSGGLIFAAVAIVVSAGILLHARRIASSPAAVRIGLGFILGGALGNLIDRVRLGYV
ncbi:MAG TPA: signal peptidase II, partial [Chloroflexota bacterium]